MDSAEQSLNTKTEIQSYSYFKKIFEKEKTSAMVADVKKHFKEAKTSSVVLPPISATSSPHKLRIKLKRNNSLPLVEGENPITQH